VRRSAATILSLGIWLLTSAAVAHAHGGMVGPDELGPPMAISGALAIMGYWLMMVWPFDRKDPPDKKNSNKSK
jgi:hypothetical protein